MAKSFSDVRGISKTSEPQSGIKTFESIRGTQPAEIPDNVKHDVLTDSIARQNARNIMQNNAPDSMAWLKQNQERAKQLGAQYHEAMNNASIGESTMQAIELGQALQQTPGVRPLTAPVANVMGSMTGDENRSTMSRIGQASLGVLESAMQLIPGMALFSVGGDLAGTASGEVAEYIAGKDTEAGKVANKWANTLTNLGIAAWVDPKMLIGQLTSMGATEVADKLVAGTSLSDTDKETIKGLAGTSAFFAGMYAAGKAKTAYENAIKPVVAEPKIAEPKPKPIEQSLPEKVPGGESNIPSKVTLDERIEAAQLLRNRYGEDAKNIAASLSPEQVKYVISGGREGEPIDNINKPSEVKNVEAKVAETSSVPSEQGKPVIEPTTKQVEEGTTQRSSESKTEQPKEIAPVEPVKPVEQVPQQEVSPAKPNYPDYGTPGNDRVVAEQVRKLVDRAQVDIPNMPTREVASLEAHAKAAVDVFNADPSRARRIALGEESAPEGIMPRFFSNLVESKAIESNDVNTIIELAKSPVNRVVTAAGQTLRAEQEFATSSPSKAIADINEARKESQKKKFGEKLSSIIDARVTKLETELKTTQEKLANLEANKGLAKLKRDADFEQRKANRQATKQELDAEMETLFTQLVKTSSTLNAGINPESIPILMKMAKNRVSAGINTIEGLVDSLYEKLKDTGFTKRDIRDAISGYGREPKPRERSEVEKDLSELKKQAKIISAIEDLESGKTIAKNIPGKGTPNEKTERLRKVLNSMLPKTDVSDAQKLQTQKTRVKNEIEKLQKQIDEGNLYAKERKPVEADAELNSLRSKVAELKLGIQKAGSEVTIDEAQNILDLSKKLNTAKELMDKAERSKWNDERTPQEMEYGRAYNDYYEYINNLKLEKGKLTAQDFKDAPLRSTLLGTGRAIAAIPGTTKALKATLDFSALLRQGLKTAITHPTVWAKNAVKVFSDVKNVAAGRDVMRETNANIIGRKNYEVAVKNKLAVGVREEAFPQSKALEKIPVFGKLHKISETAYTSFLQRMRMDLFDLYVDKAKNAGIEPNYRGIATIVNGLTGRGELYGMERVANTVNNVFFSPRFLVSNMNTLTGHVFDFAMSAAKGDRNFNKWEMQQSAINSVKILTTIASALYLADKLGTGKVEKDPRSSDFGKIRSGSTTFDLSGGMGGLVTLASRVAPLMTFGEIKPMTKSTRTGKLTELNTGKYGSMNTLNVLEDFSYNKLAPVAGLIKTMLKQEDFEGNKPTFVGELTNLTVPLPVMNAVETYKDPKSAPLLLAVIADGLGISTKTYNAELKKRKK